MNKAYCPRIHHGLTLSRISNLGLDYSVCCWAKKMQHSSSVIDFYNKDFEQLREFNRRGVLDPVYCETCISQENQGKKSMRQGYLDTHNSASDSTDLQYLDINIDYSCNLACMICGPDCSTTWKNELGIRDKSTVRPQLDEFINTHLAPLNFEHLREIRIWGGEPFLTNTHQVILNYVASCVDVSSIKLMYNTNGTQLISPEVKKLIEQFQFARISFSIDALGAQFDYQRYPAKWSQVEQNLNWWKNNLPHNSMLSLTVSVGLLNVLDLDQVYKWHKQNFSHSVYGDPIEIYSHQVFGDFGLEIMPAAMIEYLKSMKDYCQPWIQNLQTLGSQQQRLPATLKKLQEIDTRRNQNLADVAPVTAQLLGYNKLANSGM